MLQKYKEFCNLPPIFIGDPDIRFLLWTLQNRLHCFLLRERLKFIELSIAGEEHIHHMHTIYNVLFTIFTQNHYLFLNDIQNL